MKYFVALLILIFPSLTFSQGSKIRTDTMVINDLVASWAVGFSESGTEPSNIRTFNKFKSLFTPDAAIEDEIDAVFNPESSDDPNPYKTITKPVDVYAHDLSLDFKKLHIDTVYSIKYNTDSLQHDSIIRVTLVKKMSGEKYLRNIFEDPDALTDNIINSKIAQHRIEGVERQRVLSAIKERINERGSETYRFQATNQLLIRMKVKHDTLRIISISNSTPPEKIHCLNDDDDDGVIDEEDSCRNSKGDLTAFGCLDDDLDGIANRDDNCDYIYGSPSNHGCPADYFTTHVCLSAFAGLQLNSVNLSMPELSKLGYSAMDMALSNKGSVKNPSMIISPVLGADLSYFFGTGKKKFGISFGISFTSFSATYEISDSAVYTFKSFDGADYYRRMITLHTGSKENIQYSVTDLPLLFRYRTVLGKDNSRTEPYRWNIELGVGPSYILFNNKSNYHSKISYEGLYQVDTVSHDAFTYYDRFDPGSSWNVLLTANDINAQSSTPGDSVLFSEMNHNGYDFYSNKKDSGDDNNASRSGFAVNFKFDACYKIGGNERTTFVFGIDGMFAPLPDQSSGYIPFDKTTDPYQSIYKSKASATYFSIGLHAGFIFRW